MPLETNQSNTIDLRRQISKRVAEERRENTRSPDEENQILVSKDLQ